MRCSSVIWGANKGAPQGYPSVGIAVVAAMAHGDIEPQPRVFGHFRD
jgi:hypothetical protein